MALEIDPPRRDPLKTRRSGDGQMRALWRLTAWGGAAALALTALAATTQTETGAHRLKLALNPLANPTHAVAELPRRQAEKDAETRALEGEVRRLAADRDRLATRLSSLEHQLDGITGSIGRQTVLSVPVPAAPPPPIQPKPAPVASSPAATAMSAAAVTGAATRDAIYHAAPIIDPLALPPGSEREGWWPVTEATPTAAPPLTEAREIVPLPPTRLAAQPAARPAGLPAMRVASAPPVERRAPAPVQPPPAPRIRYRARDRTRHGGPAHPMVGGEGELRAPAGRPAADRPARHPAGRQAAPAGGRPDA